MTTTLVTLSMISTGVAIARTVRAVFVANSGSNTVSVINPSTHSVTATVGVGSNPGGVAVSHAGTAVYVTNDLSNTVSVINPATKDPHRHRGCRLGS
jgi:YVTN family beta-propeller protein